MKKAICAFVFVMLAFATAQQPQHFDGKTWWHHVEVLANDNMDGRDTGSPGLQRAEAYVVDQLQKSGLQPAGVNGFYQPIKLESREIVEKDSSAALVRNGKAEPLVLGEDAFFATRSDLAPKLEAPLVFIGYGMKVPEKNYDDLAGLDLKGKVVVILSGLPEGIPGPLASHYQTGAERWKALRAAGVIGIITIPNPASMDIPWSRMSANRTHPSMELVGAEFNETQGQQLGMTFNPERADKLFETTGHKAADLFALAKDHKPLPHFALPISIRTTTKLEKKPVESANIVARLEGSDPKLKNEYVVFSAHIDHVGIGEPINGDRIYNGAMDNASGSAALLDVAAELKNEGARPKRSLLFVFVCGEEKGLLGSKYFTAHPTVDRKSMVANLNLDMWLPIVPFKVLTVLGLDESEMGDAVRRAAESQNMPVEADPEPQRNRFIRSDQYNFIRHGIPAVALKVGFPGELNAVQQKWLHDRYHAPSDDLQQPVDLQTAAKFEEIVRQLLLDVANDPHRPQWKPDSFFRRYATM
jgi:Zn-dependent M28 family amino/carboxypeptidase